MVQEEILCRRTFAIISHPDAGKTTLTEKLLLFRGAISTAGAVKNNKLNKAATFDFLEIEKPWHFGCNKEALARFIFYKGSHIAYDKDNNPVFFADTARTLRSVQESYLSLKFHFTSDIKFDSVIQDHSYEQGNSI